MNRKNFAILFLIAGVVVVLAVAGRLGNDSGPVGGSSAGEPFLQGLATELDDIGQVLIDGAGGERLVSLERNDQGWTVAELGGYPAERAKVNALLIALGEARIVEEKTADPEYHARLGVEDMASPDAAGLLVSLISTANSRYGAILGAPYSGGQRYARASDSDQSVLVDRDPEIPSEPEDWVFDEILDLAANRIQRVEIAHADGESLVIRKDARSDVDFTVENVPADRELQYPGIADVTANLLTGLRLDQVERRPEAAADPAAVVEFRAFDGLLVQVTAEAATDDDEPWLSFSAGFDSDQAAAFSAAGTDAQDTAADPASAATDISRSDVSAEADEINARLSGWRYRVPSYKYSQLTRRMEDLLRAAPDE
jgi:hypothetical protein